MDKTLYFYIFAGLQMFGVENIKMALLEKRATIIQVSDLHHVKSENQVSMNDCPKNATNSENYVYLLRQFSHRASSEANKRKIVRGEPKQSILLRRHSFQAETRTG